MSIRIVFVNPLIKSISESCTRVDVGRNGQFLSAYDGDVHVGSWPLRHIAYWRVVK